MPWTVSVNAGTFFTEMIGKQNTVYKRKEFNAAYGLSISRKLFRNIAFRTDFAKGMIGANNLNTIPGGENTDYRFYREYLTDVNAMISGNVVIGFLLCNKGKLQKNPLTLNVWAGAGMIHFETQFEQTSQYIYYGKIMDTYKNIGASIKCRLLDRTDAGFNYVLHFYDGYNLDATNVYGPAKDKFSYAYVSLNFLIGKKQEDNVTQLSF